MESAGAMLTELLDDDDDKVREVCVAVMEKFG